MTAHILFPKIDPVYPATISYEIMNNILRDEMGFKGVIISDDLEMKGISESYSLEEIVTRGVKASMDIFLCCHTLEKQRKILTTLKTLYSKGGMEATLIRESIERIISLKRQIMN
jgi:beta-N-acetylhexosaminidase